MFSAQTLFEFAIIAGAIFGTLVLASWGIHRKQCPPELRWPKPRRYRSERSVSKR